MKGIVLFLLMFVSFLCAMREFLFTLKSKGEVLLTHRVNFWKFISFSILFEMLFFVSGYSISKTFQSVIPVLLVIMVIFIAIMITMKDFEKLDIKAFSNFLPKSSANTSDDYDEYFYKKYGSKLSTDNKFYVDDYKSDDGLSYLSNKNKSDDLIAYEFSINEIV